MKNSKGYDLLDKIACFYTYNELWPLFSWCHAVTFCCFLWIKTRKINNCLPFLASYKTFCCQESKKHSFVEIGQVFRKLFSKYCLNTVFKDEANFDAWLFSKMIFLSSNISSGYPKLYFSELPLCWT